MTECRGCGCRSCECPCSCGETNCPGGCFWKGKPCGYDKNYAGICTRIVESGMFCVEHNKSKCWKCGKQASYDCDNAGQLVCGLPCCGDHPHYNEHTMKPKHMRQYMTPTGWESRAAFPSPEDILKDYESAIRPKLDALRKQVVERLKQAYGPGKEATFTIKTIEETVIMRMIVTEAERAGWEVKEDCDMRDPGETYFKFTKRNDKPDTPAWRD